MLTVDARGLCCPEPVLKTREALSQKPEACRILVDNGAARDNVTRFAQQAGYNVELSQEDHDYILDLTRK